MATRLSHVLSCLLCVVLVYSAQLDVFTIMQEMECGGVYRLSALSGEESVASQCMDQCLQDPNCGGFNVRSNQRATVCEFLSHIGIAVECAKHESTAVYVRDTRQFRIQSTFQDHLQVFLRCPDFSVANASNASIAADEGVDPLQVSSLLSVLQSTFEEKCLGQQVCAFVLDLNSFFAPPYNEEFVQEAQAEYSQGTPFKVSIDLQCQASVSFNEDVYFNAWSSTHWASSRAQTPQRKAQWQSFLEQVPAYNPKNFFGRGAIIVAGGPYLEPALVLALRLREMGFNYPIQFWHLGPQEVWPTTKPLIRHLNIETRDFLDFVNASDLEPIPANVGLRRFQLKPIAILHSNLKEVLLLDADNIPVRNPDYLFSCPEFKQTGSLFWPDYWTTSLQNPIWKVSGATPVIEWEQESGQLVINKEKAWRALHLCVHMNNEFYMRLVNGDKDSFRFAWKASNTPYHMIATWPSTVGITKGLLAGHKTLCGHTMLQHDPTGAPLFVHHNQLKDLVFAVGSNFQSIQDRTSPCRAVPKPGLAYGGKVVPCFEFQAPGINFIDDTSIPVNFSHLEMFELRYASALRTVRTALRPDRIRNRRDMKAPNATSGNTTFYVDGVALEYVSNCSAAQNQSADATNTTDRVCSNMTRDFIVYYVSVASKTASNANFGLGSALAYFVTKKGTSTAMESPQLTVCDSLAYQFVPTSSVSSAFPLTITTTASGGAGVSVAPGVMGAPAVFGQTLVLEPTLGSTLYYASTTDTFMGNQLLITSPIWQNMFLGVSVASRFNTAFIREARLFALPQDSAPLTPSDANMLHLTAMCKETCMALSSCLGLYVYRTALTLRCFGLSDLGVPTRTMIDGQSWKKVEP